MNIPPQLQDPPKIKENWWQSLQRTYQQVAQAINGNVEFGNPTSGSANVRGVWVTVTTPGAPNTDFTITHNLGRPAVGFLVATKSAACDVYTSPTANPNPLTQSILRATTTANLTIFVF